MPIRLLLFSIGVIAVGFFPQILPVYWLIGLSFAVLLIACCTRHYWLISLLCGLGWGIYSAHKLVSMELDEFLVGRDLQVIGVVSDLPDRNGQRVRFTIRVHEVLNGKGEPLDIEKFPKKIQLSWYTSYNKNASTQLPELTVGQVWQLGVRLKRPRGFVNPAGFDYQIWLMRQGIGATGYVLTTATNHLIDNHSIAISWHEWIDRQRQYLQQWILSHSNSGERGILIALLIGDSGYVEKEQWQRMQQTGTSHLIAISGLHVGFLALFGFYCGLVVGKSIQLIWRRCPALMVAWITAIACSSFYSALAGFNIPTLRTLVMLMLFYGACLWQRSIRISDIFCCALALVVIVDPLAAYDIGFWLSFGAVALLLFYFSGRWMDKFDTGYWRGFSIRNMLYGFVRSQWVMFVGLLIPLSVLVNSVSLVAPIANALAIPLITFFVVPLLLTSAVLKNVLLFLSDFLLVAAGYSMEWLKMFLQTILDCTGEYASPVFAFSPALLLLISISCLVLLMPKGLFPKAIGWFGLTIGALFTYAVPPVNTPELKISFMDVGQGSAIVVQVKGRTLVYDTGPQYTESFDAGGAILAPYLHSQGISAVDVLVISHNDMDHKGGANSFLEKIKVKKILSGEPEGLELNQLFDPGAGNCHHEQSWYWHGVEFIFVPVKILPTTNDNNKSCVLLIRYSDQSILLPGDIETRVENQLLSDNKIPHGLTLLLAAHHGSRTSSGARFVSFTKPQYVIYSAGYHSQHGHPHSQVRRRFQAINSRELNTAESGAIIFEWFKNRPMKLTEYRKESRRYWFD